MNNYLLETKKLNEKGFDYLNDVFIDLNADSLDDLYSYFHKLQDCTITINNNESLNEQSSFIIRVINDVYNDYNNFKIEDNLGISYEKKIILDIHILNESQHDYLKQLFNFPDYYGENLDALYDCMSELDETEIIIINMDDVNDFSLKVINVFDDVADEYHNIKLTYEYDETA